MKQLKRMSSAKRGLIFIIVLLIGITGSYRVYQLAKSWFPPNVSEQTMRAYLLTWPEIDTWHPGAFRPVDSSADRITGYKRSGNGAQVATKYVTIDSPSGDDHFANNRVYHEVLFLPDETVSASAFQYSIKYEFDAGLIPYTPVIEDAPNADESAIGCMFTSFVNSCSAVLRYKDHVEILKLTLPITNTIRAESIRDLIRIVDSRPMNQRQFATK